LNNNAAINITAYITNDGMDAVAKAPQVLVAAQLFPLPPLPPPPLSPDAPADDPPAGLLDGGTLESVAVEAVVVTIVTVFGLSFGPNC